MGSKSYQVKESPLSNYNEMGNKPSSAKENPFSNWNADSLNHKYDFSTIPCYKGYKNFNKITFSDFVEAVNQKEKLLDNVKIITIELS